MNVINESLENKPVQYDSRPFPHLLIEEVLDNSLLEELIIWFESTDEWKIIKTSFYEQYEFSLLDASLPSEIQSLIGQDWVIEIKKLFHLHFQVSNLALVDVTAHKHINGQSIGIHNDYIEGDETHRLVIQVNTNWREENGGFLMMFDSDNAQDLIKVVRPLSNSALGFEISERSFHAVSQIFEFKRYSLVYTFKAI